MNNIIALIFTKQINRFKEKYNTLNRLTIEPQKEAWYEDDKYIISNKISGKTDAYDINGIIELLQQDQELLSKIIKLQ